VTISIFVILPGTEKVSCICPKQCQFVDQTHISRRDWSI